MAVIMMVSITAEGSQEGGFSQPEPDFNPGFALPVQTQRGGINWWGICINLLSLLNNSKKE